MIPRLCSFLATVAGSANNALVVMNSDLLIAIDGEYGTLSEIASGSVFEKTIIGLGTRDVKGVVPAKDAKDAVERAFAALT